MKKLAEVERVRPGSAGGAAACAVAPQAVSKARLHPLETVTAHRTAQSTPWTAQSTPEIRLPRAQALPVARIAASHTVAELDLSSQTVPGGGVSGEQVIAEVDIPGAQTVAEVDLPAPETVCRAGLVTDRGQTLPLPPAGRHLVPGAVRGDRRRPEAGLSGVRRRQSARAEHAAADAQVQLAAVRSAQGLGGEAGRRRLRPAGLRPPADTQTTHQDPETEQQTDGDAQRQVQDQPLLAV